MAMNKQAYPETEWAKARLGRVTASMVHHLFTKGQAKDKYFSKGCYTYLDGLLSEITTGTIRQLDVYGTQWGSEYEPEAANALRLGSKDSAKFEYFGKDDPVFFPYGKNSGGSPDALEVNIVHEIKCFENPTVHWQALGIADGASLKVWKKEFWYQLQMNMVSVAHNRNLQFADMLGRFTSYDARQLSPDMQIHTIDVQPCAEFHEELPVRLAHAMEYMKAEYKLRKSESQA